MDTKFILNLIRKNSFYIPNFFYDKLDKKVIENDINEGDKAIRKVLKLEPIGFRTPHFGTFQSKSHLSYLQIIKTIRL